MRNSDIRECKRLCKLPNRYCSTNTNFARTHSSKYTAFVRGHACGIKLKIAVTDQTHQITLAQRLSQFRIIANEKSQRTRIFNKK